MAKNADILKVELAESAVTLPHYWNIQVGNWLRLCILFAATDFVLLWKYLMISSASSVVERDQCLPALNVSVVIVLTNP